MNVTELDKRFDNGTMIEILSMVEQIKTKYARIQEVGELSDNVCKGRDVSDDIGDCIVVLTNIMERHGLTLQHCMQTAYDDIKDRKGMMIDGVFVKDADNNEEHF